MSEQLLVWSCQVCGLPIADREGYVHVDALEANRRMIEARESERARNGRRSVSLADLLALPKDIPWQVHHTACAAQPDGPDYWIDVETIRRMDQLMSWSLHVTEKNWVNEATDWHEFAAAAVARFTARRLEAVK